MQDYTPEDRRKIAQKCFENATESQRVVLKEIIDDPTAADNAIAKKIAVSPRWVYRVRQIFSIPRKCGLPQKIKASTSLSENYGEEYLPDDNRRLDAGICEINLHGDDKARYLDLLNLHRRGFYLHKGEVKEIIEKRRPTKNQGLKL